MGPDSEPHVRDHGRRSGNSVRPPVVEQPVGMPAGNDDHTAGDNDDGTGDYHQQFLDDIDYDCFHEHDRPAHDDKHGGDHYVHIYNGDGEYLRTVKLYHDKPARVYDDLELGGTSPDDND
jgi:hypothetical protein